MAATVPETATEIESPVRFATSEEGRALFEYQARKVMGMSGEGFIRRWEAGEYDAIADVEGQRHIMRLAFLIPFARQEP